VSKKRKNCRIVMQTEKSIPSRTCKRLKGLSNSGTQGSNVIWRRCQNFKITLSIDTGLIVPLIKSYYIDKLPLAENNTHSIVKLEISKRETLRESLRRHAEL